MRRKLLSVIVTISLLGGCGIGDGSKEDKIIYADPIREEQQIGNENKEIISDSDKKIYYEDNNYKVYEIINKEKYEEDYEFIVFNKDKILVVDHTKRKPPGHELSDDGRVVLVRIGYGTAAFIEKYIDLDSGNVSEWIMTSFFKNDTWAVSFGLNDDKSPLLLLTEIFGNRKLYYDVSDLPRFYLSLGAIPEIIFLENDSKFCITYYIDDERIEEKEACFKIE